MTTLTTPQGFGLFAGLADQGKLHCPTCGALLSFVPKCDTFEAHLACESGSGHWIARGMTEALADAMTARSGADWCAVLAEEDGQ